MEIQTLIERRTLLVNALNSGEFEQGRARLNYNNQKYCCLGVACEIALRNGLPLRKVLVGELAEDEMIESDMEDLDPLNISYDGHAFYLPVSVQEWYGFESDRGHFNTSPTKKQYVFFEPHLAAINDGPNGYGLEIAGQLIQENWIDPLLVKESE